MTCNCHSYFHDYLCYLTPKCDHCFTRLDIGTRVIHSHNCPTHTKCQFCGISETLEGTLHYFNCPKLSNPENQQRIRETRITYRLNNRMLDRRPIEVPNFDNIACISDEDCPICSESSSNVRTKCGHYFHKKCLEMWCSKKLICPICRNNNFF